MNDLLEIERQVVGTMLGSEHAVAHALDTLVDEDFQSMACRIIFQGIKAISGRGEMADITSVSQWMKQHHPEANEIRLKLADLLLGGPGDAFMTGRCNTLIEAAGLRRVRVGLTTCSEKAVQAQPGNGTLDEILEEVSELSLSVRTSKGQEKPLTMGQAIDAGFQEMMEAQELQTAPGFQTGIGSIDDIWGGMRKGEMIVVAGGTGLGKSLLAANIVVHAASHEWEWLGWRRPNVAMFVTEMRLPDISKRLISLRADLDMSRVRDGRLDDGERAAALEAAQHLRTLPIAIDAKGKAKLGRVLRIARAEKRLGRLDLVVIDLISHIRHEGKIDSREQQLAQVSQEIADLAVDLDVPVLVTSQVNRDSNQRANKAPVTDDLRYSAAIGHDASIVSILYRMPDWSNALRTDLAVTKNRNGGLGTASLRRVPRMARFTTWDASELGQEAFVS